MKIIKLPLKLVTTLALYTKNLSNLLIPERLVLSTMKSYEQLEKEILTTETKIKNIATNRVRTLATKKYIDPIKNDVPAIDNILSRYTLLVQIDQKLTNKETACRGLG